MTARAVRPLAGVVTVIAIVAVIVLAATLFRGGFTTSVPVTVISPRAGLVMNPDAKVQIRGVQVGKVASIEQLPNGQAAIHLAMDPKRMSAIPANVLVEIASTTVFGAKYVQFVMPPDPSPESLRAGQVLAAKHVMVEINTVFENLTSVLSKIDPPKLNEALGGIASAVNGRGEKIGQMITDLDAYLARIEPSLPALSHDLDTAPPVLQAYGDAAPDFVTVTITRTAPGASPVIRVGAETSSTRAEVGVSAARWTTGNRASTAPHCRESRSSRSGRATPTRFR